MPASRLVLSSSRLWKGSECTRSSAHEPSHGITDPPSTNGMYDAKEGSQTENKSLLEILHLERQAASTEHVVTTKACR